MRPQLPTFVVLTATYGELHQGSSQVPICWRNLNACLIVIPTKVAIGKVTPENQVPLVEALEETSHTPLKDWILGELNLQSLEEWPEEQDQARKLLIRCKQLFSHRDLDLGKMSLIKHWIELTDWTPFKECYW